MNAFATNITLDLFDESGWSCLEGKKPQDREAIVPLKVSVWSDKV